MVKQLYIYLGTRIILSQIKLERDNVRVKVKITENWPMPQSKVHTKLCFIFKTAPNRYWAYIEMLVFSE